MKLIKTLMASAITLAVMPTMAYEAGDIILKAGIVHVAPKDNNLDTSGVTSLLLGGDDTSHLQVGSDTTLGISLGYMVTPHIGVELLGATPFKHTAEIEGGGLDGTEVVEVSHLPPTVSAQYYPMDGASKLQPYVGLGVNYTFFFDEKDSAGLGIKGLKPSFGLSYSAGVDYLVTDKVLVNASIWKIDIDSDIKGSAADGATVEIDPTAFMVSCGYKF